jgi:hypothetical protein
LLLDKSPFWFSVILLKLGEYTAMWGSIIPYVVLKYFICIFAWVLVWM